MKKILFLLLVFSCKSFSQELPRDSTGIIMFSKIIPADSVSKQDLFIRCREWVTDHFKSAKDVIQYEDKDAGKIVCKGNMDFVTYDIFGLESNATAWIDFKLSIDVKDNKVRCRMSDFVYHCIPPKGSFARDIGYFSNGVDDFKPKRIYYDGCEEIKNKNYLLNKSLTEFIKKGAVNSDW